MDTPVVVFLTNPLLNKCLLQFKTTLALLTSNHWRQQINRDSALQVIFQRNSYSNPLRVRHQNEISLWELPVDEGAE